jgi:GAF domain-containing protein
MAMGGKGKEYAELAGRLGGLLGGERDFVANAANAAALLYRTLPDVSWAGFYMLRGDLLVLGPFQGKPACVRIPLAKGVCGAAAARRETVVVPDVDAFPGHIACDPDARSEIVLPLVRESELWGVLDLDSALPARFDEEDRAGLEKVVAVFVARTDAP